MSTPTWPTVGVIGKIATERVPFASPPAGLVRPGNYLLDESGNNLTDESGNKLTG